MATINPFDAIEERLHGIEDTLQQLINKPEPAPPDTEKYLTTEQVCKILSVSRVTLWNWEKAGILQSFRIGNLKRYKKSTIDRLAEGRAI